MIKRWTVSTFIGAGVTLALMGVVWAIWGHHVIDDTFGDCDCIDIVELEADGRGVFLDIAGPEEEPTVISDSWPMDGPQSHDFDVNLPPQTPVSYPFPVAEPFVPDTDVEVPFTEEINLPAPIATSVMIENGLFGFDEARNCLTETDGFLHPANVSPLVPMVRVQPEYPERAIERGLEGYVVVMFDIDSDGVTRNVRVTKSDPPRSFDSSTLVAISRFRYQMPVDVNGNPMAICDQEMRFNFILEDQSAQ